MTIDDFTNIMGDVYSSIEVVKYLLDLYLHQERLQEMVRLLECAQKGVLI